MDTQTLARSREHLAEILPQFGWDVVKAAVHLGYSESYAETRLQYLVKKDVNFCRIVREQKEKLRKSYTPAEWFNDINAHRQKAYDNGDLTNTRGYDEMLAKHIGAYEADNLQQHASDTKQLSPGDRAMLQDIAREYRRRKAIECDVVEGSDVTSSQARLEGSDVTEVVTSTNDLVGDIDDMLS